MNEDYVIEFGFASTSLHQLISFHFSKWNLLSFFNLNFQIKSCIKFIINITIKCLVIIFGIISFNSSIYHYFHRIINQIIITWAWCINAKCRKMSILNTLKLENEKKGELIGWFSVRAMELRKRIISRIDLCNWRSLSLSYWKWSVDSTVAICQNYIRWLFHFGIVKLGLTLHQYIYLLAPGSAWT